jgi:NADH:ubiquinone oxidoreductase subunit 4 (subunit M)
MLRFASGLLFGPLHYPLVVEDRDTHQTVHPKYVPGGDITGREVFVLTPLAVAVVVLGIFPTPLLRALEGPLAKLRNAGASGGANVAQVDAATGQPSPQTLAPVKVASEDVRR